MCECVSERIVCACVHVLSACECVHLPVSVQMHSRHFCTCVCLRPPSPAPEHSASAATLPTLEAS